MKNVLNKPSMHFYQLPSDRFFDEHDPQKALNGRIDMAFLDGMHHCEFLLRDFLNTERHCHRNSLILLHDCFPVEDSMIGREGATAPTHANHLGWWTGDVWRTALLLKRKRPDLEILSLDAHPTGLLAITNLCPNNKPFADDYDNHVALMKSWDMEQIGYRNFFEELGLCSTAALADEKQILSRFGLQRT